MYPAEELTHLALRKQLLVARSTLLRHQCVTAASQLARPIEAAEGWYKTAKKLFPYLRLASLFFGRKKKSRSASLWSMALKWGPSLFQAFRWFKQSPRPEPQPPRPEESPL